MQEYFPDAKQVKTFPKTRVCYKCTYVQNDKNHIDDVFDFLPDTYHTFSASCYLEKPIVDVKTIKERIKSMNLHRV